MFTLVLTKYVAELQPLKHSTLWIMNQEFTIEEFIKCLYSYHKSNLNRFKKNQTAAESKSILLPDSPSDKKKKWQLTRAPAHYAYTSQLQAMCCSSKHYGQRESQSNYKEYKSYSPNTSKYCGILPKTNRHYVSSYTQA